MPSNKIGTLKENSLHAEIKNWYREPNDLVEIKIDGFLIDIARENLLIEIQTGHFYSLRNKLTRLLPNHPIRVVYPIPLQKWVSRYGDPESGIFSRRRSPKKGNIHSIFEELVYLPVHLLHPNLTVEVLSIEQEDTWVNDRKGSWKRNFWSLTDRKLILICERRLFTRPNDYLSLLPIGLPSRFSSQDVSNFGGLSQGLARKMLYCLSNMNLIKQVGVQNRRRFYSPEL